MRDAGKVQRHFASTLPAFLGHLAAQTSRIRRRVATGWLECAFHPSRQAHVGLPYRMIIRLPSLSLSAAGASSEAAAMPAMLP